MRVEVDIFSGRPSPFWTANSPRVSSLAFPPSDSPDRQPLFSELQTHLDHVETAEVEPRHAGGEAQGRQDSTLSL